MAEPIKHPEENKVFHAPPGMEDVVVPLSVCIRGHGIESVWQLTDEEVWDLVKSKKLLLIVCTNGPPPPVWVGVVKPESVIDLNQRSKL